MNVKSLITSITTVLALTAGLSGPALAEFKHRYHYQDEAEKTKPVQRAVASKAANQERRVIRRDEIYLNTP